MTHARVSTGDLWRAFQSCCWTVKKLFQPKARLSFASCFCLYPTTHRLQALRTLFASWLGTQAPNANSQLSRHFLLLIVPIKD